MKKCLLVFVVMSFCIYTTTARAQENLTSDETISIQGTLLMLDDMTPHVAVVVQAIMVDSDGPSDRPSATTLSNDRGQYRFVNLKPGWYQVRCYTMDGYVYYGEGGEPISLHAESGSTLKNIDFHFAPFKKGTWKTYTYLDGLAHNVVWTIHADPDGVMWFGTEAGGVSRYDGKEFVNFTTEDGLAHNSVWSIHSDPDGVMWFGTFGGVSRYDGREFVNLTTEDGLADNQVYAICRDTDGVMWFGTWGGGVSRYDGKEFINFTTEDGLAHNIVWSIHRDPDGVIWFGTRGGGVSRYDGKEFVNFTIEDGLAHNNVWPIHRDPDGVIWFGTWGGGVSRYDGEEFVNLTTKDPSIKISSISRRRYKVAHFVLAENPFVTQKRLAKRRRIL